MADAVRTLKEQAATFRRAGRWAEAEHAYKVLLSNDPNHPDSWYNLALTQRQLGKFDDALGCYQEALKLRADNPQQIYLNRAVIYSDELRRPDLAEAELKTALKIRPDYVPAMFNLANLMEELGQRDQALSLYNRVLALAPDNFEALARSSKLRAGADEDSVRKLKQSIANPRAAAADKASLGFALGKLRDEAGAFDEAFEAFVQANRASRESATNVPPYNRAGHERFITDIIETFAPGSLKTANVERPNPPIFICGMFRSGSTLVEQILARHPSVTAGGELPILPAITRIGVTPFPKRMAEMTPVQLGALATQYRDLLKKQFPYAEAVTDKRPDNFLFIGLIKALFPNAKIVHTTREPVDNSLSVFFTHLDHEMNYASDLGDIAHYYRQYRRLMSHWKSLYAGDIIDIDYDAFVREPRPVVEKLLASTGLEWNEACLSFHEATNAVKTESSWQVRKPLYTHASGRSRNYERHLADLKKDLAGI